MLRESAFSHFAASTWADIRDRMIAIVGDACLFVLMLFVLFVVFLALHAMARFGYPKERLDTFETLHYWAYLAILSIFLLDLIAKTVVGLLHGIKKNVNQL